MIGDSTMANKKYQSTPERGWGMVLACFFDDEVEIDNHAVNGRSSKSFIDEGRWQKVIDNVKPGDYVFIQFGHNDEKPQPERHTDPGTTFDANLRRFVEETRQRGGIPVLFNAVVRRNFQIVEEKNDDDEKLRLIDAKTAPLVKEGDTLRDTHGAYLDSPRNVAHETGCAFVDANLITHNLEQSLGREESKKLHMWYKPGEHPMLPDGRRDNTHYNIYGSRRGRVRIPGGHTQPLGRPIHNGGVLGGRYDGRGGHRFRFHVLRTVLPSFHISDRGVRHSRGPCGVRHHHAAGTACRRHHQLVRPVGGGGRLGLLRGADGDDRVLGGQDIQRPHVAVRFVRQHIFGRGVFRTDPGVGPVNYRVLWYW